MGVPPKVKYKEKFDKEMKGQRPQYDLKESKIYKTLKDANTLASEVNLTFNSILTMRTVFDLSIQSNDEFIILLFVCVIVWASMSLCLFPKGEVQARPEEDPQACD